MLTRTRSSSQPGPGRSTTTRIPLEQRSGGLESACPTESSEPSLTRRRIPRHTGSSGNVPRRRLLICVEWYVHEIRGESPHEGSHEKARCRPRGFAVLPVCFLANGSAPGRARHATDPARGGRSVSLRLPDSIPVGVHRRDQAAPHERRRLHECQSRALSHSDRDWPRDDADRCDAVGERNHRQRLVRSRDRCLGHECVGCAQSSRSVRRRGPRHLRADSWSARWAIN